LIARLDVFFPEANSIKEGNNVLAWIEYCSLPIIGLLYPASSKPKLLTVLAGMLVGAKTRMTKTSSSQALNVLCSLTKFALGFSSLLAEFLKATSYACSSSVQVWACLWEALRTVRWRDVETVGRQNQCKTFLFGFAISRFCALTLFFCSPGFLVALF